MSKEKETETQGAERERLLRMDEYLKGYAFNRKLLRLARYEKEFFGDGMLEEESAGEPPLARARMFAIRHFVMGLPNGDEKLFLYYHYVREESVERCGELLGIARASAFRLKKRALRTAAKFMEGSGEPGQADGFWG